MSARNAVVYSAILLLPLGLYFRASLSSNSPFSQFYCHLLLIPFPDFPFQLLCIVIMPVIHISPLTVLYNSDPFLYPHQCAISAIFLVIQNTAFLPQFQSPSSIKIQRGTSFPYFSLSSSSELFLFVFTFYVYISHQLFSPPLLLLRFQHRYFLADKNMCQKRRRLGRPSLAPSPCQLCGQSAKRPTLSTAHTREI